MTITSRSEAVDARRAWLVGGILMIAAGLVPAVIQPTGLLSSIKYLESAMLVGSILLFAFGIRRQGSVTALRPLGTTALAVLAVVIAVDDVIFAMLGEQSFALEMVVANASVIVQAAAALIAAIQIGRCCVVPSPWNWAPAWCLAAVTATTLLYLVPAAASDPANGSGAGQAIGMLDGLVRAGSLVFLGVLAIVLSRTAGHTRTVRVLSHQD